MSEVISKSPVESHRQQQSRLNTKLNERLEYSGIFSQRNPRVFFINLSSWEQRELINRLRKIYAQILSDYFSSEDEINILIDRFVEEAFFVNLPLNKVVEIHMGLIDDLERELKFKGLHTEHLSDFRLTLIDVIAHLGEMYR
ncbi:MAG: circadian clock protein KaiA, partial [Cyanobacteria bacterium P01_A01_bin.40]